MKLPSACRERSREAYDAADGASFHSQGCLRKACDAAAALPPARGGVYARPSMLTPTPPSARWGGGAL